MFAILAYIGLAASAFAAAALGLMVLLGGSAQLGKEAAAAADKAVQATPAKAAAPGGDVSAAVKSTDKSTGTAAEAKPAALKKPKTGKSGKSAAKPKKRPATRSAQR
jgi:hypothetical protein